MNSSFVAILFVLFISLPLSYSRVIKPGFTGRYCASGSYNINSGQLSNYDDDHWCGLHEIDYRACVSISYPDNTTRMGCDNDGGVFPTCNHDSDYCYIQGNAYICCCNSDHCNDCSNHPQACVDPFAYLTTTTPTPTTTTNPYVTGCPTGAINWQKNCYFFKNTSSAFLVAEKTCNDLGGHLTSIHDEFANNFIAQYAGLYFEDNTSFWIGGTDTMNQYVWTWTDGSDFSFTQWQRGSPNNSGGNCIALSLTDGTWSTADCFKHQPFVCTLKQSIN
uniref:C-type lectin domain-containing protein n=1 Tax=Panagrolaimus sp. ES5 TaxID=591445 RepID=A0AC34GPI4_9BILA